MTNNFNTFTEIEQVYNKIREIRKSDDKINAGTLIVLVSQLIPIIQQVVGDDQSGTYKKELLLSVLHQLVENSPKLEQDEKTALKTIIDTSIPITVDLMCNIATGKIDIGKHIKGTSCICWSHK